jgi:hypothetical protein
MIMEAGIVSVRSIGAREVLSYSIIPVPKYLSMLF